MKRDFRFEGIDKHISRRAEAIFSDPSRHQFYSVFDEDEAIDRRGPRGGKVRGRKTICAHCGGTKAEHAETTEQI